MLSIKQLPAFNSVPSAVAANTTTTVTCKLNLGEKVHAITLQPGVAAGSVGIGTLQAPTLISEIRLLIDGKVQRRHTAQELNYIQTQNGAAFAAKTSGATSTLINYLTIFLAERWRQGFVVDAKTGLSIPESELSAWPLNGMESATLEVDFIGGSGGLTAPVISGYYEYEELSEKMDTIVKWKRKNTPVLSSPGEITDLDKLTGAYQQITMFPTSEGTSKYITSVELTRNNGNVRKDVTRYQNDAVLTGVGMNPTALDLTSDTTIKNTGAYNLVLDYTDKIRDFMATVENGRTVSELTLRPTFNAAPGGGMIMISQITGPVE
jgi:hypothetical protein